jgi:hypothetical protein
MGHQPEQADYIAEWTKAEAETASVRSARVTSLMKLVVAPLAVVAVAGGVAWGAKDWGGKPNASPELAAMADGPSTTGSLDAKARKPTALSEPKSKGPAAFAQAEGAKPPEGNSELKRAWVEPDAVPATELAAREPEPVEPVIDGAVVLPPARPGDALLRPRLAEREARPKPAAKSAVAEVEEAANPRIPERQVRPSIAHVEDAPKPRIPEKVARPAKPALAVAELEEAPAPPRKARPVKPAKPVVAKADEERAANRPLHRRTLAATSLHERQAAEPPRLEVRRAQRIEVLDVEVSESGEHVVRGRSKPVWVVEGERNQARPRTSSFPSEFVSALRHYNTRYSMQTSLND